MGVVILLSCVGVAGIAAWLLMRKALRELESACRCATYSDGSTDADQIRKPAEIRRKEHCTSLSEEGLRK